MEDFPKFLASLRAALDGGDEKTLSELLEGKESLDANSRAFLREVLEPYRMRLRVLRGGRETGRIVLEPDGAPSRIVGIEPGLYSVESETGRLLWERELEAEHVLWSAAFPGRELDLAASEGEAFESASIVDRAAEGCLEVAVHPGLERGSLVLRNLLLIR